MAHAWKACWVQALGGSNPPSSATGPRNLLRFRGFVFPDVHVTADVGVCLGVCARAGACARGAGAVCAGPFAGGLNPLMRSWALLVAVWAARLDYHLWG